FAMSLYNQVLAQVTFARNATGGDLTWGYPLSYETRVFATYKLEEVGVSTTARGLLSAGAVSSPVSANAVANLFRGGLTSSVRMALTYDTRDNRLFASRGWYANGF